MVAEVGKASGESVAATHLKAAMYGVINAIVVAPVMVGFAAIIFRHPAFHADPSVYPALVKLVLFSSMVHQCAFSACSSLPFSIGQVQDAGLIFLSKMASEVADATADDEQQVRMATVLVTLSLSTAMLGLALMLTGRLRLAVIVQYLPLPVVGGYLAFIGLYCLEAGLSLMSGVQATSLLGPGAASQWRQLARPSVLIATTPGLGCGVGILLALRRCNHFLLLPALLVAMPLLFFSLAFAAGASLDELRDQGWIAPSQPPAESLAAFRFFRVELVRWEVLPPLLPTWLGMYVVVAFSSSLDVAAIQMDMGRQLDFNRELITVGISNLLSGLSGGFTGSYIFSQTIFTFRSGTQSRVCGVVVLLAELGLFLLPFSIVSFVPKFFFGAVLTFIAADLLWDWLWLSHAKVHPAEFVLIWLSFLLVNLVGLEMGMGCGLLLAMLQFILNYARVPVVQRVSLRSNVMRSPEISTVLDELAPSLMTLRCRGYIFFGSSVQIMRDVLGHVHKRDGRGGSTRGGNASGGSTRGGGEPARISPRVGEVPIRFVVFDFTMVSGLDATAARSCFLSLCRTLAPSGIRLVFGGVSHGGTVHALLLGHAIVGAAAGAAAARCFDTIDEALEHCEEELLLSSPRAKRLADAMLAAHAEGGGGGEGGEGGGRLSAGLPRSGSSADRMGHLLSSLVETSWAALLPGLTPFFGERCYANGQCIFRRGEPALCLYVIVTGEVTLYEPLDPTCDTAAYRDERGDLTSALPPAQPPAPPSEPASSSAVPRGRRLMRYVNGGIFGELDFFLANRRSFDAVATSDGCAVLLLTRDALRSMQAQASPLAAAFEHAVLKYLCFQVNSKMGLSDGITDTRVSLS